METQNEVSAAGEAQTLMQQEEVASAEIQRLERDVTCMERQSKRAVFLGIGGLIGILGVSSGCLMLGFAFHSQEFLAHLFLASAGIVQVVSVIMMLMALKTMSTPTVTDWMKLDDVRAIGPLLDAGSLSGVPRIRETAWTALIALLPRMKSSDAALLNSRHRLILRNLLFAAYTPVDIAVAVLKAYEQIGDSRDLPVVERLATGQSPHQVPQWAQDKHHRAWIQDSRVREAAAACLPLLQARLGQIKDPETLLRAASRTDLPDSTLLRAAQERSEVDPQQLLRASRSEEAD